ncbi:hypothetical protein Tco_0226823 [Tanacetum coccineum]
MELVLEQTQQGTSYEVSVNPHGFEGIFKDGDGAINDSVVDDSATSAPPSTRVLPSSFASSSGTTRNADSKRRLPLSMQPSSSSFRPSVPGRGTGGIQIREKPDAHEWRNNLKAQLEDTSKMLKSLIT